MAVDIHLHKKIYIYIFFNHWICFYHQSNLNFSTTSNDKVLIFSCPNSQWCVLACKLGAMAFRGCMHKLATLTIQHTLWWALHHTPTYKHTCNNSNSSLQPPPCLPVLACMPPTSQTPLPKPGWGLMVRVRVCRKRVVPCTWLSCLWLDRENVYLCEYSTFSCSVFMFDP